MTPESASTGSPGALGYRTSHCEIASHLRTQAKARRGVPGPVHGHENQAVPKGNLTAGLEHEGLLDPARPF
jgi:hypothetical protein